MIEIVSKDIIYLDKVEFYEDEEGITQSKSVPDTSTAYVHIVLSNGESFNVDAMWATKFVQEPYTEIETSTNENGEEIINEIVRYRGTNVSILEFELTQIVERAQAREDLKQAQIAAAQGILDNI